MRIWGNLWNCIKWEFCPAWWLTWTVWPAWQWTSMVSTLYQAATIAASGSLDKKIITSFKTYKTNIASCCLVWSTYNVLVLISFVSFLHWQLRLWNLESKTCVQEITAHRKKFDESIFDVAFHPSRPYIARYFLSIQFCSSQPCFPQCWRRCPC